MLWSVDTASRVPLQEQIAAAVRRGVVEGTLEPGERLPAAAELAQVLGVNANTVLAAFRRLRDEGLLEFRRGRGVRVALGTQRGGPVPQATAELIALGQRHGYSPDELAGLILKLASS
jgi:DNA-binding transcriptional regulator YhcF (GntR family)